MRGFVMNGEYDEETGEETMKSKIRREMVSKLASEWNEYHDKIERRGWISDEELYDEQDYLAEQVDDIAYEAEHEAKEKNPSITKEELSIIRQKVTDDFYEGVNKRARINHERIEVIEELLYELGARMMRPYEHWNEEERYMEYMENRYY